MSLIATFILFLPTLLVAFISGSVALWKSGWAPRPAAILLLAVLVADIALPSEPAILHAGVFVLLIAASTLVAAAILRDGAPVSARLRDDGGQ